MALGAQPGQVRRLVIASALTLAGAGIAAGLLASLAGKKMMAALLFEVSPTDVVTLAGVSAALLGAALLASWLPARRATTVSPAEVLRGERRPARYLLAAESGFTVSEVIAKR